MTVVIAFIGVFLLIQPDCIFDRFTEDVTIRTNACPCLTISTTDSGEALSLNTSVITTKKEDYIQQNCGHVEFSLRDPDRWYGYILAVIAGILLVALNALFEDLNKIYKWQTIIFWNGLFGIIISVIAFIPASKSLISLQPLCLLFTVLHTLGAAVHTIVTMALTKHVSSDHVMIVSNIAMMCPFSGQTTYLSGFIPWSWNIFSVIGVALVFFSFYGFPVWNMTMSLIDTTDKEHKSKYEDENDNEKCFLLPVFKTDGKESQ